MAIRYDIHMHSSFSADSDSPAEDMIQQAISKGLSGICFTDHLDLDGPPYGMDFSLDFSSYFSEINRLREKYRNKLDIGIGIEYGVQPHLGENLSALSRKYPFDFIIASQHFVNRKDPYYTSYYDGRTERECYEEFFRAELETLNNISPEDYDTLGHLDYIVRYGPNRNREYSYKIYGDLIDPILNFLIDHGKCMEINTAGYQKGLGGPNPSWEVIQRYRELGGELITIGADAHEPANIGYAFNETSEMLKKLGFRYYTVFYQRKGSQIPL